MKCPKGHEMINRGKLLNWEPNPKGFARWYCPQCRCGYKKNFNEQLEDEEPPNKLTS